MDAGGEGVSFIGGAWKIPWCGLCSDGIDEGLVEAPFFEEGGTYFYMIDTKKLLLCFSKTGVPVFLVN